MAHFAKLTVGGNKVLQVITIRDEDILNNDGVKDEAVGQQYLEKHNDWPANLWVETSKDGSTRGNYAGIGYNWDATNQIFYIDQPYPSWTLNTTTAKWESPSPKPDEAGNYYWDEVAGSWQTLPNHT